MLSILINFLQNIENGAKDAIRSIQISALDRKEAKVAIRSKQFSANIRKKSQGKISVRNGFLQNIKVMAKDAIRSNQFSAKNRKWAMEYIRSYPF